MSYWSSWSWEPDLVGLLLVFGLAYVLGWGRLRWLGYRQMATAGRLSLWLSGLLVIAIALMSPIEALQPSLLFVHMVQHMLLMFLAPPLLLLAYPLSLWPWGLQSNFRQNFLLKSLSFLARPPVALGLSTVALWLWHLPSLYDYALDHQGIHELEHATLFVFFLLYWWALIGSVHHMPRLATNIRRFLYLAAGAMQAGLLGALFTFSNNVLYTHYLAAPRVSSLSVLADQQLGGAIMWFSGPLVYGLAAILTIKNEG